MMTNLGHLPSKIMRNNNCIQLKFDSVINYHTIYNITCFSKFDSIFFQLIGIQLSFVEQHRLLARVSK